MKYPPGPLNFNAYLGLTWRHWWRYASDPLRFVTELGRTYGDICFYRVFTKRIYVLNQPEWIRKVFVEEADRVVKLPKDARLLSQFFGQGLIVSEGQYWRQQRRALQRGFGPEQVERLTEVSDSVFRRGIARWTASPSFGIEEACQDLFVDATVASLFDVDLSHDEVTRIAHAVRVLSRTLSREMASLLQLPDWLPLPSKRAKRQALGDLQHAVRQIVRHASAKRGDRGLVGLLQRSAAIAADGRSREATLLDEVTTMLVAGSHTAAAAMVWVWHCLARHADVQTRARLEVDAAYSRGSLAADDLPYTDTVLREVLRLYPPAWALFFRLVMDEIEVGPYTLPKGSWVAAYPFVTHRDERYFPNSEGFDPDRFSAERQHEIPKHAFFPYGVGPHTCIGASLANAQMLRLMALVLREFELGVADEEVGQPWHDARDMVADLAIRPRRALQVRLTRREAPTIAIATAEHPGSQAPPFELRSG